jgi:tripartite-type tricarboxylate transporter receptor subunit TctC
MGIAANACKSAPPDGSTICLLTQNAITLNPLLYAKLSYNPYNDLDPIAVVALQQQVLAVVPSLGIASVAELVKYSKANPNRLNYASLGLGSDSHLIMEWLKGATGADLTHIPFNGSPPILTAMRSGEVHVTLLTSGTLKPQIDAGELKALATRGADKRNPSLPDVPTFAEASLPPLRATSWAGLFGPAGTPPEIIARLNREFTAIINDPDFRARFMVKPGLEPSEIGLADIRAFMAQDRAGWEPLVKTSGVQLQ